MKTPKPIPKIFESKDLNIAYAKGRASALQDVEIKINERIRILKCGLDVVSQEAKKQFYARINELKAQISQLKNNSSQMTQSLTSARKNNGNLTSARKNNGNKSANSRKGKLPTEKEAGFKPIDELFYAEYPHRQQDKSSIVSERGRSSSSLGIGSNEDKPVAPRKRQEKTK